jgi:hypothetical protein
MNTTSGTMDRDGGGEAKLMLNAILRNPGQQI